MMKKHLLILFIAFISFFSVQAQTRKGNYEKVKAFKVAFLSEKLNLTEEEANKFWPLYNVYDKKMIELYKAERYSIKKKILSCGGIDSLTDKESKEIVNKIKLVSKERYETKTNFYDKLSIFLSDKKILTLEVAEHEFHRKLIKKLKGEKKKHRK
ncbi:hypothetical protein V1T75_03115 [Tenacibaculum sp. FZY0031]|uniref:hypothetical protein n=1 Tax=unclassified Tenacibaculum TaxID=2635139 RepID=UPI002EA82742|nr:hypothetical protein [Tenacibaculum sp. FZY0031]